MFIYHVSAKNVLKNIKNPIKRLFRKIKICRSYKSSKHHFMNTPLEIHHLYDFYNLCCEVKEGTIEEVEVYEGTNTISFKSGEFRATLLFRMSVGKVDVTQMYNEDKRITYTYPTKMCKMDWVQLGVNIKPLMIKQSDIYFKGCRLWQ